MSTAVPFPGHAAPAVGFDQPVELLHACHDRVERSLALLARLVAHVRVQGHGDASRSAAVDVLRYFDRAAPHHHEDEERHVLPRLLASPDAATRALAVRLLDEHRRLEALWAVLRVPLQQWADGAPDGGAALATVFPQPEALAAFTALYARHIADEEGRAYPLALAPLAADTLAGIGAEMAARRRAAA